MASVFRPIVVYSHEKSHLDGRVIYHKARRRMALICIAHISTDPCMRRIWWVFAGLIRYESMKRKQSEGGKWMLPSVVGRPGRPSQLFRS